VLRREFKRDGAPMEKALCPQDRCVDRVGGVRGLVSATLRLRGNVSVQEVRKVWRAEVVKAFVCEEEKVVLDYSLYGEPVELLKDGVTWSLVCVGVGRESSKHCPILVGSYCMVIILWRITLLHF